MVQSGAAEGEGDIFSCRKGKERLKNESPGG
jgi:hypothetical protein